MSEPKSWLTICERYDFFRELKFPSKPLQNFSVALELRWRKFLFWAAVVLFLTFYGECLTVEAFWWRTFLETTVWKGIYFSPEGLWQWKLSRFYFFS